MLQKDKMLATVWHDKRDVLFLSTNNSHTMDHVNHYDKHRRTSVAVPCPSVVKFYNENMGRVDSADQMRGCYSTVKKSRRD